VPQCVAAHGLSTLSALLVLLIVRKEKGPQRHKDIPNG
jgi:hypothetical protein